MPTIRESKRLPYSCEQMFDLVADVDRYPEFLPWVVATRVRADSETEMTADMLVGFKAIREKFTSRVTKARPHSILVHYVDGPLRDLDNSWAFEPDGEEACRINFCVDFTFKNKVFEALAGQYADRAFRKMVAAFETRAAALYGSNSSSATSAA
ncbi:type II toxin-antitoxin system RatA family toxin [Pseudoblastomonas halimionae]|uniref:Type II toxin-antitoxin system RatA family toxin n=1 Tax=Alteriqipengyuania halimionae TaxID=1926630 RepID=A0A6I4U4Y5_9SPHN|nr:type II toxin-antitoxin system RatA family toxin [Alteriqipengyuania halimionae]MXP09501.1 type II toxin-antitoxin system RatA family toxin [Alteriqipengyuania halimionae]